MVMNNDRKITIPSVRDRYGIFRAFEFTVWHVQGKDGMTICDLSQYRPGVAPVELSEIVIGRELFRVVHAPATYPRGKANMEVNEWSMGENSLRAMPSWVSEKGGLCPHEIRKFQQKRLFS